MSVHGQSRFKELVEEIQNQREDNELHWFVDEIVIPEFPQIVETLHICSNLLLYNSPQHPDPQNRIERGPAIKLPVSSSKSESLKGIVVRDGAYITQFQVAIRDPYFNRYFNKVHLVKPILLNQIINTKVAIDDSTQLMQDLSNMRETLADQKDHDIYHKKLIKSFENLLSNIHTAKTNLQLPTDPNLVFPLKITPSDAFAPILPQTITVDFYISQAEICIDMKSLYKIVEKPWSEVDPRTGKSHVDKVRDEMKLSSSSTSSVHAPEDRQLESLSDSVSTTGSSSKVEHGSEVSEKPPAHGRDDSSASAGGFLSNVMSHFKPKYDPMDYITRCITYDGIVVMVNKKLEVSTEDPVLVSCFTKLDTIEYLIRKFLKSLNDLTCY
ncbi:uncharacterized protein LODBEIA_P40650 [Lodderomyces beijingensis]|uniref:Regulator of V-ATPase in vacuolar membrane protein 2 n=1 Tax=Lodderomyces beijingensis TaxID=1775926 RepID=A0ABP0ZSB8_9ASCO